MCKTKKKRLKIAPEIYLFFKLALFYEVLDK